MKSAAAAKGKSENRAKRQRKIQMVAFEQLDQPAPEASPLLLFSVTKANTVSLRRKHFGLEILMLEIKETLEHHLAGQRGEDREKRRGEKRAHAEQLNDTLGEPAIQASNTIKFSVSLRENPFTNAAKQGSKRNLKGSGVKFSIIEPGLFGTTILTTKQEECESEKGQMLESSEL